VYEWNQNGVRLSLGTMMTPAPEGRVAPGQASKVVFAVHQMDGHMRAGLRFQVNQKDSEIAPATWLWTDPDQKTMYFQASLPSLAEGDLCSYHPFFTGPMMKGIPPLDSSQMVCFQIKDSKQTSSDTKEGEFHIADNPVIGTPATLNGFNMIFAMTQAAIFNATIDNDAYADHWAFETYTQAGKKLTALNADVAPPRIQIFNDSLGQSKIRSSFPLMGGSFGYWVPDPNDPSQNVFTNFPVDGWELVLEPELFISGIPWDKLTPEVRAQLANFNPEMFAVKQVALNLQNVNLFAGNWSVVGSGAVGIDPSQPSFIRAFRDTLVGVFEAKRGTENPYVFGHIVNQESLDPNQFVPVDATNASFNPTGVTYSLYANPNATTPQQRDRNSLNYLLMVDGQLPSSDPLNGRFPSNWVANPASAGAFVVDNTLFMTEMLKPVAADLNLGVPFHKVAPNRFEILKGDILISNDKLPWYVSLNGRIKATADVKSTAFAVAPTNKLVIENEILYKLKITTGINGVAKKELHYLNKQTFIFTLGVNDRGRLGIPKPEVRIDIDMKKVKDEENTWWKVGNATSGLGGWISQLLLDKQIGNSLKDVVNFNFDDLNSLTFFLLIPGGKVLIYSDARFTNQGHLYLDVQYDSESN